MDKREKEKQKQQEDAALHKFLCWAGGAALLDILLLAAKRYRVDFMTTETDLAMGVFIASQVVTYAALALAVAAGVWAVIRARAGKKGILPAALAVFFAGLSVSGYVVWHDDAGVKINTLVAVFIVAAVLALVYYLYQHDFFSIALVSAVGILGVWLFSQVGRGTKAYLFLALAAVGLLAIAAAARLLQGNKGVLKWGGKELRILPVKANYALVYISCVLILVLLVAALFLMGGAIPPALFYAVPVAWVFIMAVYYTVKLM